MSMLSQHVLFGTESMKRAARMVRLIDEHNDYYADPSDRSFTIPNDTELTIRPVLRGATLTIGDLRTLMHAIDYASALHPMRNYHEDLGAVLCWYKVGQPPYVGCPNTSDYPGDRAFHGFSRLVSPPEWEAKMNATPTRRMRTEDIPR